MEFGCQLWIARGEQSGLQTRIAGDGKRFVVRVDEKLTAFLELESAIRVGELENKHRWPQYDTQSVIVGLEIRSTGIAVRRNITAGDRKEFYQARLTCRNVLLFVDSLTQHDSMTTKEIIRVLTIAALLAVVFGAYGCQGPKPNAPAPASVQTPTPAPHRR